MLRGGHAFVAEFAATVNAQPGTRKKRCFTHVYRGRIIRDATQGNRCNRTTGNVDTFLFRQSDYARQVLVLHSCLHYRKEVISNEGLSVTEVSVSRFLRH